MTPSSSSFLRIDVETGPRPPQIHHGAAQRVARAVEVGIDEVRDMHHVPAVPQIGENRCLHRVPDIVLVRLRHGMQCRSMKTCSVIDPQNPGIDVA